MGKPMIYSHRYVTMGRNDFTQPTTESSASLRRWSSYHTFYLFSGENNLMNCLPDRLFNIAEGWVCFTQEDAFTDVTCFHPGSISCLDSGLALQSSLIFSILLPWKTCLLCFRLLSSDEYSNFSLVTVLYRRGIVLVVDLCVWEYATRLLQH